MHSNRPFKPSIFGKGYGVHVSYNLKIAKAFLKLAYKLFINAFFPSKYYDEAYGRIVDFYYKMRGHRHGTPDLKRCNECGSQLEPRDDNHHPILIIPSKDTSKDSTNKE